MPNGPILVVDDDPTNLTTLRQILEQSYRLVFACNGEEALVAVAKHRPSLILLDIQMPDMDGYEGARRIREEEARLGRKPVPIVALTANALEGDRERCLATGMNDYLAKPFRIEELQVILKQLTGATSPSESLPVVTNRPYVSREPLAILRNMGGEALVQKVLQLFFVNTPLQLEQIKTAILTGDTEAIRHAAHSIKSAAANVGAIQFSELARIMEHAARDGLPETDTIAVNALEQADHEAVQALQQQMEST